MNSIYFVDVDHFFHCTHSHILTLDAPHACSRLPGQNLFWLCCRQMNSNLKNYMSNSIRWELL